MKNKSNLIVYGVIFLILLMGIYLSVKSVNQTQETRSSAVGEDSYELIGKEADREVIDGLCGSANGQVVAIVPENKEACEVGAINWVDSKASDGEYNWFCLGTIDGKQDECTASVAR